MSEVGDALGGLGWASAEVADVEGDRDGVRSISCMQLPGDVLDVAADSLHGAVLGEADLGVLLSAGDHFENVQSDVGEWGCGAGSSLAQTST
jgi:hypothetical protein